MDNTKPELDTEPTVEEIDYLKYGGSGITVKDLNVLKDIVMGVTPAGWFAAILAGLKLFTIAAYFYIRHKVIAEEKLIEKNRQAQAQANQDANEANTTAPRI